MQVTAANVYMDAGAFLTATHKPFSNWATSSAASSEHAHRLNKSILFYSLVIFLLDKLFSVYGNFWDAHSLSGLRTRACWMTVAVCGCLCCSCRCCYLSISLDSMIFQQSSSPPWTPGKTVWACVQSGCLGHLSALTKWDCCSQIYPLCVHSCLVWFEFSGDLFGDFCGWSCQLMHCNDISECSTLRRAVITNHLISLWKSRILQCDLKFCVRK